MEDQFGEITAIVFPALYEKTKKLLKSENVVIIDASISEKVYENHLLVTKISPV